MIFNGDMKALRATLDEIRERDGMIVTLSVGRFQGFQNGHKRLLDFHEEIGDKNIIVLGSCQESGTLQNPFTTSERIEMIRRVKGYDKRFSGKLSLVKLNDINAVRPRVWRDYVLEKVESWGSGLPRPNVYIGGSENDIIDNGFDDDILAISLDRLSSGIMSGTDVRKCIINGNDVWREHVPYVIQDYMLSVFPRELKLENRIGG